MFCCRTSLNLRWSRRPLSIAGAHLIGLLRSARRPRPMVTHLSKVRLKVTEAKRAHRGCAPIGVFQI
jgi:hypothetical protein